MSNILLREKVIQLRLEGKTYGQIKRDLKLPKSTLSNWLSKLPLSNYQLSLLSKNKVLSEELRIERFRLTCKNKRLKKLQEVYKTIKDSLVPLTDRELLIAGLFLYWGEGAKKLGRVCISNTDPKVMKFSLYWMINILKIPKEKIKIGLHIYQDMDIEETIRYWSEMLDIPTEQFNKPYIKKSTRAGLTYKSFGHGTCNMYVCSVDLSERIAMSIKVISDLYGAKDKIFWYN